MTADATLSIGPHTLSLEYDTALRIVQNCSATARRGGLVPITPDLIVWVTQATPISLHRVGQFTEEYADMLTSEPPQRDKPRAVIVT